MVLYTHKNINKSIKRLTKFVFFLSSVSATNNTTGIHHLVKNDVVTMIIYHYYQCNACKAMQRDSQISFHTRHVPTYGAAKNRLGRRKSESVVGAR